MFMHKHFGIIPARRGSKGILRKNLQLIGNKPLLQFTLEAALGSQVLDFCILSSDDHDAIELSKKMGIDVPFIRPSYLSEDNSSSVDVVLHALEWYRNKFFEYPENIVLLQPTSPFRNSQDIDEAIREYEKTHKESLVSVCEVSQHPSECIMLTERGSIERIFLSRDETKAGRQGYKRVYFIDGGIYISSVNRFLKRGTLIDDQSGVYVIPKSHGIDIDDIFDLELARALFFYSENMNKNVF